MLLILQLKERHHLQEVIAILYLPDSATKETLSKWVKECSPFRIEACHSGQQLHLQSGQFLGPRKHVHMHELPFCIFEVNIIHPYFLNKKLKAAVWQEPRFKSRS